MSDSTSEILNKAADLIQERGWAHGAGWPKTGRPADAPLCLEGGIFAAQGVKFDTSQDEEFLLACPAYRAVMDYLASDTRWGYRAEKLRLGFARAFDWNDASGRTATEVIEVLRSAATIEQARENELTHNGVTYVAGAL